VLPCCNHPATRKCWIHDGAQQRVGADRDSEVRLWQSVAIQGRTVAQRARGADGHERLADLTAVLERADLVAVGLERHRGAGGVRRTCAQNGIRAGELDPPAAVLRQRPLPHGVLACPALDGALPAFLGARLLADDGVMARRYLERALLGPPAKLAVDGDVAP